MKHLSTILHRPAVISLLLVIFLGISYVMPLGAHAAYDPTKPVNQSNYDPADVNACGSIVGTSCTKNNADKSVTTCTNPVLGNPNCSVKFPDGSTAVVKGDLLYGQSVATVDTSGATTSVTDTGVASNGVKAAGAVAQCTTDPAGCAVGIIANIAYYLMTAAGFLLGIVGNLFNWIITVTVFQYAVYFGNSQGMLAAWGILRDIGNVAILFGFIMIGMMMILDVHSIDTRKALPRLLIFAVLMNFSLFAGEAAIDIANVLSATIYKQAGTSTFDATSSGGAQTLGSNGTSIGTNTTQIGIAGLIMQQTFAGSALASKKPPGNDGNALFTYIGITIFLLITMVVMLAAVIMFAIRAVLLTFLLVISPLGFAAMAIPQFQERGRQWQQQLLQNAFFAPTFLLMIFISIKVMEAARSSLVPVGANGSTMTLAAALESPSVSTGGIIIIFALMIGFMIAALKFAQSSGVAGAQFATSYAQKTVRTVATMPFRFAGGAARGAGSAIGRNVVGKRASTFAHGYDAWLGKMQDPKKSGVGSRAIASVIKNSPIDSTISGVSHNLAHGYEADKKKKADRTNAVATAALRHDRLHAVQDALGMPGGKERDLAISKALTKMSAEDRLQELYLKGSEDTRKKIAKYLSPEQMENDMKNDKIPDTVKAAMRNARYEDMHMVLNEAKGETDPAKKKELIDRLRNEFTNKLNEKDWAVLAESTDHSSMLGDYDFVSVLNDGQADKIKDNQRIDVATRDKFVEVRKQRFDAGNSDDIVKGMNNEAVGNLPGDIVTRPNILGAMRGSQLAAINPDKLNPDQRNTVIEHIRAELKKNSPVGVEFGNRLMLNPDTQKRWQGLI